MVNKNSAKYKLVIFPMEKELVLARFDTWPRNLNLMVGNRSLTIDDMIREVKEETDLGLKLIEMEMKWLRSFKTGEIWAST